MCLRARGSERDTNTNENGFGMLNYIELEIGGQCIDKHYGEWMTIWADLTHTHTQRERERERERER
jgi:hypothetical protein